MKFDASVYEDEFLDDENFSFKKINHKAKSRNTNKKDSIRKQRKAKDKEREKLLYELSNKD